MLFPRQNTCELEHQLNKYTSTGMKHLTAKAPNEVTKLKTSVSIKWSGVLKTAKAKIRELCQNKERQGQRTPHQHKGWCKRRGRPPKFDTPCIDWQQGGQHRGYPQLSQRSNNRHHPQNSQHDRRQKRRWHRDWQVTQVCPLLGRTHSNSGGLWWIRCPYLYHLQIQVKD